jgi:hypothetical protein
MKLRSLAPLVPFLTVLAGCASVPNVKLDTGRAAEIKSIAILKMFEPNRFAIRDFYTVAALGGPIGGAVHGSVESDWTKTFLEQVVQAQQFKFAEAMEQDLTRSLVGAGYSAQILAGQKVKKAADGKTDDFSDVATDRDAILAVWFGTAGFLSSEKLSTEFQPSVTVNVELVDAKSKVIILRRSVVYGYKLKLDGAEFIDADAKYQFGNFDDLMARKELALDALSAGLMASAERIAKDIHQP